MAHPANRTNDFAPAWLKLEQNQQRSRQDTENYNNPNSSIQHHQLRNNSGHSSYQHKQLPASSYHHQHLNNSNHYSNSHNYQNHQPPSSQYHHQSSNPHLLSHHRSGRAQVNNYHSSNNYNGNYSGNRSSLSGPSPASSSNTPQQHQIILQRSQSTGSYNDSVTRVAPASSSAVSASQPLDEDFPQLRSGSSGSAPTGVAPNSSQLISTTAQWRIKERSPRDDSSNKTSSGQSTDKLLTSNMTGKVYRAQVKPVKRSTMIPININNVTGSSSDSLTMKTSQQNGDTKTQNKDEEEHAEHTVLSSSLDKEKKFLQELGWREDEESDDECGIPEQDLAQLELLMKEAKASRQRVILKSKQSMKTVPRAIIPNDDDIPSSSDNSDCE